MSRPSNHYRTATHRVQVENVRDDDELFSNAVHGAFNVTKFERLMQQNPKKFKLMILPLTPGFVNYVTSMITVDPAHVEGMAEARRDEPCKAVWLDDPQPLLLVDGHHRVIRRHRDGLKELRIWLMPTRMIPMIQVGISKERL